MLSSRPQREDQSEELPLHGEFDESIVLAAMNCMAQGMVVYDRNSELVMHNASWRQIYGINASDLWRGMPLTEVVELQATSLGLNDTMKEAFKRPFASINEKSWSAIRKLPDGRSVQMSRREMGLGYFVMTHEDITAHVQMKEKLQFDADYDLRELNEMLRTALETMDQGLIVVDRHGHLPVFNSRALELLDLPEELMKTRPTAETVIAYQQATGDFDRASDEVQSRLLPRIVGEARNTYERERSNGTVLEVRTVPLAGGGIVRTYTDVTSRKKAERLLEEQANSDGLTGLANRRQFDLTLRTELARARRTASSLALIMLDIDYFKALNDHYGHLAGDACLQRVSSTVAAILKRPGDIAARYGGEEFAILLPNTELRGAKVVAEQIRLAVAELNIEHQEAPLGTLTLSAGVTAITPDKLSTETRLIVEADKALYDAKHRGRNCVAAYMSTDIKQSSAA